MLATARARTARELPHPRRQEGLATMRIRRARGAALLVTAATVMLASGCAVSAGAASPPQVEKPNLTVAVVPALDSAGFFIALYGGLFRDQGLNVNFIPATSSET